MVPPNPIIDLLTEWNHERKDDEREQVTFASAISFLANADTKSLSLIEGSLYKGSLGPGEMLWAPAAMVTGEQISDADHSGVKWSLLAMGEHGDKGLEPLRTLTMEAPAQNRRSAILDEILDKADEKASALKAAAAAQQLQQKADADAAAAARG